MEDWFTPCRPSPLPDIRKVLVLAPHPDDEVFGCGGTLALLRQSGADIHVHVLTDGGGYSQEDERQIIVERRREETDRALRELGIDAASHAGFRDRGLSGQAGLAQHLVGLIEQLQPQLVFAPSLWEIHPDHLALSRAALAAVTQPGRHIAPTIMFYEIGSPQRSNCLIDVTPVWELKQRAMSCFPSQLAQQDYLRQITGLNQYRSYTLPAEVHYAEAFTRLSADELQQACADGADPVGRLMGRWIETALSAADAQCEMLQSRLAHNEQEQIILLTAVEKANSRAEIANYRAELADSRAKLADSRAEEAHSRAEVADSRAEVANNRAEEANSRAEMANGRAEMANREYQEVRQSIAAMMKSTSWRITAPMRWLSAKLRR